MNRQYSISGFSLYEILFAVAITAILAAIALPAYQRYVKDARLKTGGFGLAGQCTCTRTILCPA